MSKIISSNNISDTKTQFKFVWFPLEKENQGKMSDINDSRKLIL